MAKKNQKMVEEITAMDVDFAQWYTDICKKAELVSYTSVKGCMVIRPYGYAIWENIQRILDGMFKATGHVNVNMPMFIPESLLEKEKDHVLRTAVILATVIIVLGGIVVAVRLNNPKQDTTKGRKILSEMDRTDVGKVNKKIQKLEEEERVKEEAADNRSCLLSTSPSPRDTR